MGLTRTESAVLALWDLGVASSAIAARLQVRRVKVEDIISTYHVGADDRLARIAMITGSRQLAAAIRAARTLA